LKSFKSPGSGQIPAGLIEAGGEILRSKILKLIKSIWNKEELPDQWKKSIIVPVHKKGENTGSSNYGGISLLSTSNNILSNIPLSKLSPHINKIIGDHLCVFRRKKWTTYQIFCIRQILEKKWEYNERVHQLFVD
jgi:hypothetical protein